jgi:hypothetical protein
MALLIFSVLGCQQKMAPSESQRLCAVNNNEMGLDNGILNVKLDLTRGGAIFYISKSDTNRNIINIHDEGRYVQQSYYAGNSLNRVNEGQNSSWSPWAWNPIQVGDSFKNRAEILECNSNDDTLYVKCIPMLWDMNNKPAEAVMEQWTVLKDNVIKVHNKFSSHRTDDIYGENIPSNQELPAVYPISALKNLYSYFGTKPFMGEPITEIVVEHLEDGFWGRYEEGKVSEHWMAFVDDNNWGIGVYTPITSNFLAGMYGESGGESKDNSTSYISPVKIESLKKIDVLEYDYYLIIGNLDKIRSEIYKLNDSAN